jgi:hypothetical protein
MRFLVVIVLTFVVGCSIIVANEDERICLDWKSRVIVQERCIPYYGAIMCVDEEKVRTWCVLYEELEPMRKDDA